MKDNDLDILPEQLDKWLFTEMEKTSRTAGL